ncbi:MAG: menaquinone biosynthesis protein [Peptococcaceae bacterium]|nr:menaquinone biosynthesis protein [Peptococcaceae bacterium]
MADLRLGQLEFINNLPIYHGLEENIFRFDGELIKGPPNIINRLLFDKLLDVAPVSSIEYGRNHKQYLILPDLCIGSDGRVGSVLLFSSEPLDCINSMKIAITKATATSVVLLQILLEHYWGIRADFYSLDNDPFETVSSGRPVLLIGDEALMINEKINALGIKLEVTDLGDAWKSFTGCNMVYAIWVVRKCYAKENSERVNDISRLLSNSKDFGLSQPDSFIKKARLKTGLSAEVLRDYFIKLKYDFKDKDRQGLRLFYDYAYKSGIIKQQVNLSIWGENNE